MFGMWFDVLLVISDKIPEICAHRRIQSQTSFRSAALKWMNSWSMSSSVQALTRLPSVSPNISHSFWHMNNMEKSTSVASPNPSDFPSLPLSLSLSLCSSHTPWSCPPPVPPPSSFKYKQKKLKHQSESRFSLASHLFQSIFGTTTPSLPQAPLTVCLMGTCMLLTQVRNDSKRTQKTLKL